LESLQQSALTLTLWTGKGDEAPKGFEGSEAHFFLGAYFAARCLAYSSGVNFPP
jgi:hypothetical protein